MVMRFSSGRIGHISSTQTTIDDDGSDDEGDIIELEEVGCDGPNEDEDLGLDEVETDEEIDYGYVDKDEGEEEAEGDDENGDGLGPEDGEEGWEEDILELEGYAEL
jgi:hypothetical protein